MLTSSASPTSFDVDPLFLELHVPLFSGLLLCIIKNEFSIYLLIRSAWEVMSLALEYGKMSFSCRHKSFGMPGLKFPVPIISFRILKASLPSLLASRIAVEKTDGIFLFLILCIWSIFPLRKPLGFSVHSECAGISWCCAFLTGTGLYLSLSPSPTSLSVSLSHLLCWASVAPFS